LVASGKGANGCLWFGLGVLFGPFGLLFSFFAGGQKCPYCKKGIHSDAIVCPYCQRDLKNTKPKIFILPRMVTLDGYNRTSGITTHTINVLRSFSDTELDIRGTANHGETVNLIRLEGNCAFIETSKGIRGWVTAYFIKEFKQP
jgi:hypothetical protein